MPPFSTFTPTCFTHSYTRSSQIIKLSLSSLYKSHVPSSRKPRFLSSKFFQTFFSASLFLSFLRGVKRCFHSNQEWATVREWTCSSNSFFVHEEGFLETSHIYVENVTSQGRSMRVSILSIRLNNNTLSHQERKNLIGYRKPLWWIPIDFMPYVYAIISLLVVVATRREYM